MDNLSEFELIDSIVAQLGSAPGDAVLLGPGDDAAMLQVPAGDALVTSVDTLVSDLHFPAKANPWLIGQRALRVSVSDLAAMGATPLGSVVALTLPVTIEPHWVSELSRGFGDAAKELACPVTGGNLTRGELAISVTVQGGVPPQQALLRSGAAAGDDVWVSGPLGGAALGLAAGGLEALPADALVPHFTDAARAYFFPQPQLGLGVALRGLASAAIDISDGLASDVGHIARASKLRVALTSDAIPRFTGASLEQALHGGDDYQLCFTAPARQANEIRQIADEAVRIGSCLPADANDATATLLLDDKPLATRGFDHFLSQR